MRAKPGAGWANSVPTRFATIVNAIEEGRAVFENIRKFLTYILTSNIPELVPYLISVPTCCQPLRWAPSGHMPK